MRFSITAFCLVFVLAFSINTHARDTGAESGSIVSYITLPDGQERLPYQALFEAESQPGEALDAFVLRLSPSLRSYTDETGYEACGVITTANDIFYVMVGTNHGHTACVAIHEKRKPGSVDTGQTIHSHPRNVRYQVNSTDILTAGVSNVKKGQLRKGSHTHKFSVMDYQAPGYLVNSDDVLHQAGPGTVRTVGRIPAL